MEHEDIERPSVPGAQPGKGLADQARTEPSARTTSCERPPRRPEPATSSSPPSHQDGATRAACLVRLATALSSYGDLAVTAREDGPTPCLAARNTMVPAMSETITITRLGDGLVYRWSWGERIGDASDPDAAAHAIAYVLGARGTRLGDAG